TDDQRSDSVAAFNRATTGQAESKLGYVESPNLDALAAEGTLFTNAYCNSMACAPSRSSMHTGRYPHRSGMYGFRKAHQAVDVRSRMIPEVMLEHGYQPSMFGKSGYYIFDWENYNNWKDPGYYDPFITNNTLQKTDGSDFWFNKPWSSELHKVIGTEEVFRYADGSVKRYWTNRVERDLTVEELETRKEVEAELDILRSYTRSNPELIIGGVSPAKTGETLDGAIVQSMQRYFTNEGKDYTTVTGDRTKGPDPSQPLFVNLGFVFPHTPVLPTKEFRDRFKDKQYRIPEYEAFEAESMPGSLRDLREDMDFSRMTDEEKQQAIRDYYAFCAMGDHLIGQAIQSFKDYCAKHDQEYLILYVCGDHGWHLGEQGIEAKFGPWYQTVHDSVIAVSSDKSRFPSGKIVHDWVEFVDFAPTFYEMAEINSEVHPGLDGVSLLKTLYSGPQRDYVIGEMNQVRGDRAYLRSEDFAFAMRVRPFWTKPGEGYAPGERIRWGLDAPTEEVDMSLYDLRLDPDERRNVAQEPEYQALAAWFRQKLGSIVLGDGRLEVDWTQENVYSVHNFAKGAHDGKLDIPESVMPHVELPEDPRALAIEALNAIPEPEGPYSIDLPEEVNWESVAELSDEFEGDALDLTKWHADPMAHGWGWVGRPPAIFLERNVSVDDGKMKVTVGKLDEPVYVGGDRFVYEGAIVRSILPAATGMYVECRMKANATEMSSTFWLMTKGDTSLSQELDIQECIGKPVQEAVDWAQDWDRIFHSNMIRRNPDMEPDRVQLQDQRSMTERNSQDFHVYGAWWKSEREVLFYLDGEYQYTIRPEVDWNMPAYIHMAIETYDWNPVGDTGTLIEHGTLDERTTQYDWIRTWRVSE
ncbi:MAG: sulfatase-like hydrolase/transferase, partial [Opitutales bacterium]|nr:sulfatase-like hydrolase/transferase [Opitutales bacterium]